MIPTNKLGTFLLQWESKFQIYRRVAMLSAKKFDTVLGGGRVIDPAQGMNKIADVGLKDGKIADVGDNLRSDGAEVIDASGYIVTPGLFDMHVHAYGILGFSHPDWIGIYQGVTTFVEAGGPGVRTFEEFTALMKGHTITNLYGAAYFTPMGIIGFGYVEGDVRTLTWPVSEWLDVVERNRDTFRYLKIAAFGNYGTGPIKVGKGLAEILNVPLYVHIGDFTGKPDQVTTPTAYRTAEKGDIITHLYTASLGNIINEDGKVMPEVKDAARRGVLLDVGFGQFNFSFDVAEKALAQDVFPHIISSDLQQVNVTGPTYSLTNVMSIFLMLGLTLPEVIERVTIAPARALSLDDRAGSLRPGTPADVSVLKVADGEFVYADCVGNTRKGKQKIAPVMTFKDGKRYDADLELAQDVRNWCMQISENAIPDAAESLDSVQKEFLARLAFALEPLDWDRNCMVNVTGVKLHDCFHRTREAVGIPLRDALWALYKCFLEEPFTYQAGLFLLSLPKPFAMERIQAVAGRHVNRAMAS
jgi:dihydroorotase